MGATCDALLRQDCAGFGNRDAILKQCHQQISSSDFTETLDAVFLLYVPCAETCRHDLLIAPMLQA